MQTHTHTHTHTHIHTHTHTYTHTCLHIVPSTLYVHTVTCSALDIGIGYDSPKTIKCDYIVGPQVMSIGIHVPQYFYQH